MIVYTQGDYQKDWKKYLPVHAQTSDEVLSPYLDDAERFLVEHIGTTLYNYIDAKYIAAEYNAASLTDNDGKDKELLEHCQRVMVRFAYSQALIYLPIQVGNTGVTQNYASDSIPADQKTIDKARYNALDTAYDALEYLIWSFLLPNKSVYQTEWADTDKYTFATAYLVNSPAIFSDNHNLAGPGRLLTWMLLRPYMKRVERRVIKTILCESLYTELKGYVTADSIPSTHTDLMGLVRETIVEHTVQMGLIFNQIKMFNTGLRLKTSHKEFQMPTLDMINSYFKGTSSLKHTSEKELIDHLVADNTLVTPVYTGWKDTDCGKNYFDDDDEDFNHQANALRILESADGGVMSI